MRFLPFIFALLAGAPAMADPGHLAEAAGHDHWAAAIAIGVAVGVGVWGALKGRRDRAEEDESETAEAESGEQPQEA